MLLVTLDFDYFFIFMFMLLSLVISVMLLVLSFVVSYKKEDDFEKISAYECGFEPFNSGSSTFDVHFYIVGILFIIFDLELVFLYPWAINFYYLGAYGYYAMFMFLVILTVGFVFEWRKGALDWSKSLVLSSQKTSTFQVSVGKKGASEFY